MLSTPESIVIDSKSGSDEEKNRLNENKNILKEGH